MRNSLLSTCSLPSTSSILKAMWNPVCGSATAMHCQLPELYLSIIENPHMYQHTWLVGHSIKTAWKTVLRDKTQIRPTAADSLSRSTGICRCAKLGQNQEWKKKYLLFLKKVQLPHKIPGKSIHHTITESGGRPCKAQQLSKVWGSTYWSG